MDQTVAIAPWAFEEAIKAVRQEIKRTGPLASLQEKSWHAFVDQGALPTKRRPGFAYVPLKELYARSVSVASPENRLTMAQVGPHVRPESKHSYLVFVDGRLLLELSDHSALETAGCEVFCLEEAFTVHGRFLKERLQQQMDQETDPFCLLNTALFEEGVFIYVPPGLQLACPLQIIHLTTADVLALPRVHLVVGKGARLCCHLDAHHRSTGALMIPLVDVLVEEEGSCRILDRLHAPWTLGAFRGSVKKGASLEVCSLMKEGALHQRRDYHVRLKEENASVNLSGLSQLEGHQSTHVRVKIEHDAPSTHSMQLFKAVLEGMSRASFAGQIAVDPEAQQTQAYQLNKTLMLSPHAIAYSEPNLRIGADDVKASHGATIAALDEKQLFYFGARGIDPVTARRLMVEGFTKEILDRL